MPRRFIPVPPEVVSNPPSREHISSEIEDYMRSYGTDLNQKAGILLKLPQATVISAQVIFHRFYYRKSFAHFDVRIVSAASIFVATKVEESQRRAAAVVQVYAHLLKKEKGALSPTLLLNEYCPEFVRLRDDILRCERYILRELGFEMCLVLDHPHKFILQYLHVLFRGSACTRGMARAAWGYLNDSFRTTVCCRFRPHQIAVACIHLAAKKEGILLPKNPPWWVVFDVDWDDISLISQFLDALYERGRPEYIKIVERHGVYMVAKAQLESLRDISRSPSLRVPPSSTEPEMSSDARSARESACGTPDKAHVSPISEDSLDRKRREPPNPREESCLKRPGHDAEA